MMGTTNPVAQCTLRCNVDTQCMDRVFDLFARILPDVKGADVAFGSFCKSDADASDALKDGHCVEAKFVLKGGGGLRSTMDDAEISWDEYEPEPFQEDDAPEEDDIPENVPLCVVEKPSPNRPGVLLEREAETSAATLMESRSPEEILCYKLMDAVEKMFKAVIDMSHCTTDYSTKWQESVGTLLPDVAKGINAMHAPPVESFEATGEPLVTDSYIHKKPVVQKKVGPAISLEDLVEQGRRTLTALQPVQTGPH